MALSADSWMKEYNEALKLADDINGMISERSSFPALGADAQRYASAIRRKITILRTRLDSIQSLLLKLPGKLPMLDCKLEKKRIIRNWKRLLQMFGLSFISFRTPVLHRRSEKYTSSLIKLTILAYRFLELAFQINFLIEMNRRKDMIANLRSKVNQMASTLNMSNFANRDSLLGSKMKPTEAVRRTVGLDNSGLVGLQRQIMKEQDEGLGKLEETVVSTKHIALAVNEELDLHTRLIDDLDQHVYVTDSRLRVVQKHLAILNKRTKGSCSCTGRLFSVIGIVVLVSVIWLLIKYL
ncbi:syntaxin-51-like [Carya illinoinensis]|nr:syntaxin-51-like [Carya illinoinensis]